MTAAETINILGTGVPGLDDILGGGVPELSFNLISGLPGCGKTTLSHQMMFAMASPERPVLYLTLMGEHPLKMLRYQHRFSFFDAQCLGKSIHYVNLPEEAAAGLEQLQSCITTQVQSHRPALVFIDSVRTMLMAQAMLGGTVMQQFLQRLSLLMATSQVTTFLIGEYADNEPSPASAVADGLILLRQSVYRNSMVRKIEIMKMRGQPILPGLHTFRISKSGVTIFPPAPLSGGANEEAPAAPDRGRVQIGVPGLDAMLGGGLPRGYSLLVAGPSGSGKSILASAFLSEGVRQGETGVVAVFEQSPHGSRSRVVADLIEGGQVGLVDSRSTDLSIDEIVLEILKEIARLKASRVVIDSLSGFELAVAPTFQADFRESLARMVSALARTGVTVLMTCELEDRYTDLRFSPYGTAFMTDAIIVQRYVELNSQLERVIAVIKVRSSAHSNQLRLFSIDSNGIHIGETLPDRVGLLGGRPNRAEESPRPTSKRPRTATGGLQV